MIHTAKQLKDKVKNMSGGNSEVAQALIRTYFMERFLERVSVSEYRNNFILKGGMLVASIVGVDMRATMDIDTTVKALPLNEKDARAIIERIGELTRQFLGDRIMGVFIDSADENGNIVDSAADKAINAARSLQTVIDYSLNKYLKTNVNGKVIECGIGIDYGKVLVTQVGMYGLESDENRENEVDCVWVGNTTNYASKYSDIASGGEIFISDNVFKQMSDEYALNRWLCIIQLLCFRNCICQISADVCPTGCPFGIRHFVVTTVTITHQISFESCKEFYGMISRTGF